LHQPARATLMSRGLGALQRTLLAKLQARPRMAIAARELTAEVLADQDVSAVEANRRWHATNVAVRRALAGLAKAGRIAEVSRRGGGGLRATHVMYSADHTSIQERQRREADRQAREGQLNGMMRAHEAREAKIAAARAETAARSREQAEP
jgi:hypothetical protein